MVTQRKFETHSNYIIIIDLQAREPLLLWDVSVIYPHQLL